MKEVKNGRLKFSCQHGPIECLANKIHSCAIHNIEDPLLLMKFVTCLINDFEDPENAGSMVCVLFFSVCIYFVISYV